MPYAIFDRDAFITRTGLGPDMKVLIIGPDWPAALQIAKNVETTVAAAVLNVKQSRGLRTTMTQNLNPVITSYTHLPFKNAIFDIIFSYHSLNMIPPVEIPDMLGAVNRKLKEKGRFASMVWSIKPTNKAQTTHMMLLNILAQLGLIHLYRFDEVSRWLEVAGFEEITMELVTQQLTVPEKWVRSHLKRLEEIIKESAQYKSPASSDIDKAVESYKKHAREYGEELLPSIQFTGMCGAGLAGIDVVQ